MDVGEENGEESGIAVETLAEDTSCTKGIEEQNTVSHDLEFADEFTEEQVSTLAELESNALKRKHPDEMHLDSSVAKSAHVELQPSDGYVAGNNLVTIANSVALATNQEATSQALTTADIDQERVVLSSIHVSQGCQAERLNITSALAAITGQGSHEPTLLPSTPTVEVQNDGVNQAWFTTKEDKDNLHGKGVKWRQGMWSKEENDILKSNIHEYCKMNNIADPNIIIFDMSKDDRKDFYRNIAKGIKRPLFAIYRRVLRMYDRRNYIGKYSTDEVQQLKSLKEKHGKDWASIGAAMGRSASSVKDRFRLLRENCQSGKWTIDEEEHLSCAVHELSSTEPGDSITGGISWSAVAEKVGTRSEKQCRSKWLNYLNWKEKGGKDWTKKDEIELINRIYDLDIDDENLVNWQTLMTNWTSARSPQWLRSKWWALKKHVPVGDIRFREAVEYLRSHYVDTLQSKIERHESRFKGSRLSHGYMSAPSEATTGLMGSSSIAHTITVNSDGSITRDEDSAHGMPTQGRYEVVQLNTLAVQDGTYTQASQVQPSYIIHSVPQTAIAGQTYIIQQPTIEMVRHPHTGQVDTNPIHNEQVQISSQGVVMTATVLHPHHAEVNPELAQAIVQTNISGPITPEFAATHHLTQTNIPMQSHQPTHTTIPDSLSHTLGITLQQPGQTHIQSPVNQELDSGIHIVDAARQSQVAVVDVTEASLTGQEDDVIEEVTAEIQEHTSTTMSYQQGPAAIAQSLDGTELSTATVTQQISPQVSLPRSLQVTNLPALVSTFVTQTFSSAISASDPRVSHQITQPVSQSQLSVSTSTASSNAALNATNNDLSTCETQETHHVLENNHEVARQVLHEASANTEVTRQTLHPVNNNNIVCRTEVSHHALQISSNEADLSASDVMPQAVLPEQFLQSQVDDPVDLSLPSSGTEGIGISSVVCTEAAVVPTLHPDLSHPRLSSSEVVVPITDVAMATAVVTVTSSDTLNTM